MKSIIEVKNLTKIYDNFRAVDDISFSVKEGEIFGLLGENGAGKTTTLEMIEGLRKPNQGKIKINGLELPKKISQTKQIIGVQLQSSAYFEYLTLEEILNLFGSFYEKSLNPTELLKMVDLEQKIHSYVKQLSGGQKQRFSIIASLINDPKIVFLDEPTTGLDPVSRRKLWEIIAKIKDQGKTVVLTTHYMEEAEILCDRIGIMASGKIIALEETHKLIENVEHPYKIDFFIRKDNTKALKQLKELGQLSNLGAKTNHYELRLNKGDNIFNAINIIQKIEPESLTVGRARLEDVFIELTGKKIEDDEVEND